MKLTQFEELSNEDQLEINKRVIVSLANECGENYKNYLSGKSADMNKVTESIDEFTGALRMIGVKNSHFINWALLTGFFCEVKNKNSSRGEGDCYIYAIYCEETGMTKIGRTTRFKRRIKEIQNMSPSGKIRTILKIKADPSLESKLHREYGGYRQHGEWFFLDENIRANLKNTAEKLIRQD